MSNKIQLRRDTSTNWTTVNPILTDGEPGLETDTNKIKYGNGGNVWVELPYAATGGLANGFITDVNNENIFGQGNSGHDTYIASGSTTDGELRMWAAEDMILGVSTTFHGDWSSTPLNTVSLTQSQTSIGFNNNSTQWIFDQTGNLQLPQGGYIGTDFNSANAINIVAPPGTYAEITTNCGNAWVGAGMCCGNAVVFVGTSNTYANTEWIFQHCGALTLPRVSVGYTGVISTGNAYPSLVAFGTGGHGGPELDWVTGTDNPQGCIGNPALTRNSMWINDGGMTIIMDANNHGPTWNFTPTGNIELPSGGTLMQVFGETTLYDPNGVAIAASIGNAIAVSSTIGVGLYANNNTWLFAPSGGLVLPQSNSLSAEVTPQLGSIITDIEFYTGNTGNDYVWNNVSSPNWLSLYNLGSAIIGWTFYPTGDISSAVTIERYNPVGVWSLGFSSALPISPTTFESQSPNYVKSHANPIVINSSTDEWMFTSDGNIVLPTTGVISSKPAALLPVGSCDFNGTSSCLTLPVSANWALGTTWTVEWWSYATSSSSPSSIFPIMCQTPEGGAIDIYYSQGFVGACDSLTSIPEPTPNQWTHVALVVTSATLVIYYNGVAQAPTGLNSVNLTDSADALYIGTRGADKYGQFFPGLLTNIRIVAGVAVYTGDFAVPTMALLATQPPSTNISAITGVETLLLLDVVNALTATTDSSTYMLSVINTDVMFSTNSPDLLIFKPSGNITIVSNNNNWIFDNTSTLHLPPNGNIVGANHINAATLSGTLSTASQPNITSIGSLSTLAMSGTIKGGPYDANQLNLTVATSVSALRSISGPYGGVQINTGTADVATNTFTFTYSGGFTTAILNAAPITPATGSYYTADGVNWDPSAKNGAVPYPVFYDGVGYNSIY